MDNTHGLVRATRRGTTLRRISREAERKLLRYACTTFFMRLGFTREQLYSSTLPAKKKRRKKMGFLKKEITLIKPR